MSENQEDSNKKDEQGTENVQTRWWLTNDLVVFISIVSFYALIIAHGARVIDLTLLPQEMMWALITVVLASATWALGIDLLEKWGK